MKPQQKEGSSRRDVWTDSALTQRKLLSELVSLTKCCQCFLGRFESILFLTPPREGFCSRYIIRHKGKVSWSFLFSSVAVPINIAYICIHNSSLPLSPTLKVVGCGWVSARRVHVVLWCFSEQWVMDWMILRDGMSMFFSCQGFFVSELIF